MLGMALAFNENEKHDWIENGWEVGFSTLSKSYEAERNTDFLVTNQIEC